MLDRELSPHRWGWKAARLSTAARRAGVAVPAAICFDQAQAPPQSEFTQSVLASWLRSQRPARVIVRSSGIEEDGETTSGAGRLETVRDVNPDAEAVIDAVDRVRRALTTTASAAWSVIVQHQVPAELMGVTFTRSEAELITEGSATASAVTDGLPPEFRMHLTDGSFTTEGDATLVPVGLAAQLHDNLSKLRSVFGFQMDVEWALVAGHLFILQVRPVTVPI